MVLRERRSESKKVIEESSTATGILSMLYQLFYLAQAKEIPLFQRIHVFYTTLVIIVAADSVVVIHRDPAAMQALINNLTRISHSFHGNHFRKPAIATIVASALEILL